MPISRVDDACKRLSKDIFRPHSKPLIEILAQIAEGCPLVHPVKREEVGAVVNDRLAQCQDLNFLDIRCGM